MGHAWLPGHYAGLRLGEQAGSGLLDRLINSAQTTAWLEA
jgi:hypothetical protein